MPASHREPASSHLNSIFLVSMSVYNVAYPFSAYNVAYLFSVYNFAYLFSVYNVAYLFSVYNVAYLFSVYDVAYLFSVYNVAYSFSVYIRDCRNYAGKDSASQSKWIKKGKILGKLPQIFNPKKEKNIP